MNHVDTQGSSGLPSSRSQAINRSRVLLNGLGPSSFLFQLLEMKTVDFAIIGYYDR